MIAKVGNMVATAGNVVLTLFVLFILGAAIYVWFHTRRWW